MSRRVIIEAGVTYTDIEPDKSISNYYDTRYRWEKYDPYYESESGSKIIWILAESFEDAGNKMNKLLNNWNRQDGWKYWCE